MIIFSRFGKYLAGNTNLSVLIIELLQKVQILTNELRDQNFLQIYFYSNLLLFTVNLAIKTLTTDIKAFFYLTKHVTFLTFFIATALL